MVDAYNLQTHLASIRSLLAATQERCDTLLSAIERGHVQPGETSEDVRRLCGAIAELSRQCDLLESQLRQ